ncbi:MAG: hypothetical protein UHW86_02120 [Spirochaetota bacterium]|nr:hypothetical protein [Spirochaetota bacterium]
MKKRIFILITYILALSSVYSFEYSLDIGAEAKILPITADFYNEFSLTGFEAEVFGAFVINDKFGLSWQIADNYMSQTSYGNGKLASGASNIFYTGLGFIFFPFGERLRLEMKQNFLWNQAAFDIKNNGVLAETQFGTSTHLNVFFTPYMKLPYFHVSLHNEFRFYPITRNETFQWEYQGRLRFTANPYIKKIGVFAEAGFSYLSCNTVAVKYDSFAFVWDIGINFSHKWKNKKEKESKVQLSNAFDMKLSPLPTLKKIKRPELYFDFYNAKVGKNVRIDGIYFDDKNQLTKDSKIKLEGLVLYLKDYPATTIVIVSYVESSLKKDEEIMNASMQRTNSIKDFLLENKIPEKQIKRSPSALIFNPELSKIPHIEIKMLKK